MAEALVSIKRLQKFLMYDELERPQIEAKKNGKDNEENAKENNQKDAKGKNMKNAKEDLVELKSNYIVNQPNYAPEYSISIENGSAKWVDYEREDTLQNINIKMRPGELIAVVGQVGSGKTSLLNVILKELGLQGGSIQVC